MTQQMHVDGPGTIIFTEDDVPTARTFASTVRKLARPCTAQGWLDFTQEDVLAVIQKIPKLDKTKTDVKILKLQPRSDGTYSVYLILDYNSSGSVGENAINKQPGDLLRRLKTLTGREFTRDDIWDMKYRWRNPGLPRVTKREHA